LGRVKPILDDQQKMEVSANTERHWKGPIGSRPKLVNYDKTDISIVFWFQ